MCVFPSNIMLYHWGDVKSVKTGLAKNLDAWTQIASEVDRGTNSWARFDTLFGYECWLLLGGLTDSDSLWFAATAR